MAILFSKAKEPLSELCLSAPISHLRNFVVLLQLPQHRVYLSDFLPLHKKLRKDTGVAFYGDNGVLRANRNYWEVVPASVNGIPVIEPSPRNVNAGNDLHLHVRNFLDAIKTRNFQTAASIEIGRNVARVAHLGNIAYRSGMTLNWNAETGAFNEKTANDFLVPRYRKPWEINKIK